MTRCFIVYTVLSEDRWVKVNKDKPILQCCRQKVIPDSPHFGDVGLQIVQEFVGFFLSRSVNVGLCSVIIIIIIIIIIITGFSVYLHNSPGDITQFNNKSMQKTEKF